MDFRNLFSGKTLLIDRLYKFKPIIILIIRSVSGENFLHGDGHLTIIITIKFVLVSFSLRPAHKFTSGRSKLYTPD